MTLIEVVVVLVLLSLLTAVGYATYQRVVDRAEDESVRDVVRAAVEAEQHHYTTHRDYTEVLDLPAGFWSATPAVEQGAISVAVGEGEVGISGFLDRGRCFHAHIAADGSVAEWDGDGLCDAGAVIAGR